MIGEVGSIKSFKFINDSNKIDIPREKLTPIYTEILDGVEIPRVYTGWSDEDIYQKLLGNFKPNE